MKQEKTDMQLIDEILSGNQNSFDILYHKYSRLYMSICLRYFTTREDAEDLLQEAVIRIYRNLSQYDAKRSNFITWSKRIVVNTCLEKLRKPSFLSFFGGIFDLGMKTPIYSDADMNLNLKDLTELIQTLPKGARTVFNMYVIDGFNHREIAEKLGITSSTSKTQLMKAKKQLKMSLEKEELLFDTQYA